MLLLEKIRTTQLSWDDGRMDDWKQRQSDAISAVKQLLVWESDPELFVASITHQQLDTKKCFDKGESLAIYLGLRRNSKFIQAFLPYFELPATQIAKLDKQQLTEVLTGPFYNLEPKQCVPNFKNFVNIWESEPVAGLRFAELNNKWEWLNSPKLSCPKEVHKREAKRTSPISRHFTRDEVEPIAELLEKYLKEKRISLKVALFFSEKYQIEPKEFLSEAVIAGFDFKTFEGLFWERPWYTNKERVIAYLSVNPQHTSAVLQMVAEAAVLDLDKALDLHEHFGVKFEFNVSRSSKSKLSAINFQFREEIIKNFLATWKRRLPHMHPKHEWIAAMINYYGFKEWLQVEYPKEYIDYLIADDQHMLDRDVIPSVLFPELLRLLPVNMRSKELLSNLFQQYDWIYRQAKNRTLLSENFKLLCAEMCKRGMRLPNRTWDNYDLARHAKQSLSLSALETAWKENHKVLLEPAKWTQDFWYAIKFCQYSSESDTSKDYKPFVELNAMLVKLAIDFKDPPKLNE